MDRLVYVFGPESLVHLGVMRGSVLLSPEACNLDAIADRKVVDSRDDVPAGRAFCHRCGGSVTSGSDATVTLSTDPEPVTS